MSILRIEEENEETHWSKSLTHFEIMMETIRDGLIIL